MDRPIRCPRESAGLSGENFLARMTCGGCARSNFNSSCADLIRVSTSLFRPAQGVDGRVETGQDEIGKAISLLWSPQDFPRTALRESGDPGTSDSNPWVPAFAGTTDMRMRAPDFVIGLQPRGLGSIPAMDTSFRRCDEEGRRRPISICYSPGFLESGGMKALSAALRLLSASIRKLALTTTRSPPPSPWRTS